MNGNLVLVGGGVWLWGGETYFYNNFYDFMKHIQFCILTGNEKEI